MGPEASGSHSPGARRAWHDLVIADIDGAAAHEAAASLTSAHGVEAEAHEVDVSDPAAVEELAASIDRAVGRV